jgi:hypothetical protein
MPTLSVLVWLQMLTVEVVPAMLLALMAGGVEAPGEPYTESLGVPYGVLPFTSTTLM